MGNVLTAQDVYRTIKRSTSWTMRTEAEGKDEDRLMSELMKLQDVELWRLHWCLSEGLLEDVPPVPPHWLLPADAKGIAKAMIRCFQEEGALMVLDAALIKLGQSNRVQRTMNLPSLPTVPKLNVAIQRSCLISRMQCVDSLVDALVDCMVLSTAEREAINVYGLSRDKNRALVDQVLRKGDTAQEEFSKVLGQSQPFLLPEQEMSLIADKSPPGESLVSDMLECLVSDELRCFQWLIIDHMAHPSRPGTVTEQLQHADRRTTLRLIEDYYGAKQAEIVVKSILLKLVPAISFCLHVKEEPPWKSPEHWVERTADTPVTMVTPDSLEEGSMFRLRCKKPGVLGCRLTGLLLEGQGHVVYETVPWDTNYLSSRGLRPAGPLFRFQLLEGVFQRLHLPHCLLQPDADAGQLFLSVAHVTGDDLEFITPGQVTRSHAVVNISSFSCFGLVTSQENRRPIRGLVLLFAQPSNNSLFVLLLPRNVCLPEVIKKWKERCRAEYVETTPDCELIPDQAYTLSSQPNAFIQPKISKFVNYRDYSGFLPSFEVRPTNDTCEVDLQLCHHVTSLPLIGWLFSSSDVVWQSNVRLRGSASSLGTESISAVSGCDLMETTHHLLNVLNSLDSQDLRMFQHFLTLEPSCIPVSRLEDADRTRTVDLMLQRHQVEGAKQVTENILRKMSNNQLADQLT